MGRTEGKRDWAYTRSSVSLWSRPSRVLVKLFQKGMPWGSAAWNSCLLSRGWGPPAGDCGAEAVPVEATQPRKVTLPLAGSPLSSTVALLRELKLRPTDAAGSSAATAAR